MPSSIIKNHPDFSDVTEGEFLDHLWNSLTIGVCLVGRDNRFIKVNPVLSRWLGYPPSELENMTWVEITAEGDRDADAEGVRQVAAGVAPYYVMDKTYYRRDKKPLPAKLTVFPIRTKSDGTLVAFLSQIERDDSSPVSTVDELRVVYDFFKHHKKFALVVLVGVALAGDGFIQWLKSVILMVPSLFGGP